MYGYAVNHEVYREYVDGESRYYTVCGNDKIGYTVYTHSKNGRIISRKSFTHFDYDKCKSRKQQAVRYARHKTTGFVF